MNEIIAYKDKITEVTREFKNEKTDAIMHPKTYFCPRHFDQIIIETINENTEIKDEDKKKIVNKVKAHISDHLSNMGAKQVHVDASVKSIDKISSKLINNVNITTEQTINQVLVQLLIIMIDMLIVI